MMAQLEKKGGAEAAAAVKEEERLLMEDATVLDFDMLCSTVAMQAHKGRWGKLNGDNEDEKFMSDFHQYGGGVFRMWEGELVYDCFDDRRIALQSTCCPCYRFGKNMKRAGFGSCFLQGFIHFILAVVALTNLLAFVITRTRCFLYLAIAFTVFIGTYLGYHRMQIRRKFNIKGGESSVDDCVHHLVCPFCTLSQESRTLEMNNVQDGIWHGRGDTICIGSFSEDAKAFLELSPHFVVSTKSPELLSMQKTSNDTVVLSASVVDHSPPLVPPPK
ncbi:hypothetical protein Sango_1378900 [Sesamum angolense]|uniref:PLAC8 family protein n=1 Tax=Sesamum angolense TaxID=2727404 RepID=A0AAE2BV64_9LAMI|nr:hypothetical protein Sango_1378900 [Sesamum angolense]